MLIFPRPVPTLLHAIGFIIQVILWYTLKFGDQKPEWSQEKTVCIPTKSILGNADGSLGVDVWSRVEGRSGRILFTNTLRMVLLKAHLHLRRMLCQL